MYFPVKFTRTYTAVFTKLVKKLVKKNKVVLGFNSLALLEFAVFQQDVRRKLEYASLCCFFFFFGHG